MSEIHVSIQGRATAVPVLRIGDVDVVTLGRWLRVATIKDEEYCETTPPNLDQLVTSFRAQGGRADIFAFGQNPLDAEAHYDYPVYWDNAAIVSIESYDEWLTSLGQVTRRNIRLAARRGVTVASVPFNDELVRGIRDIYNETPFRQGRRFWHHGKDLATVKRDNATYAERSEFIAAYAEGELIGFIKMVYVGGMASIMQILSKSCHHDKRPTNALLAKAVEICAAKGVRYLKYCKYTYHRDCDDPLTDFKRRHGFQEVVFPRYFVPLTFRGRMAITLRLQLGPSEWLPSAVVGTLLKARSTFNAIVERHSSFSAGVAQRQSG
jgi:hypothetical protein